MKLRQLINALGTQVAVSGSLDTDISGLAYDSRKVEPGFAFIAIPGENFDGHDFVPKALEAGAAAIICQRPLATGDKPCVVVPDCRQALADLSAEFYGHPDRKLRLIGVTGTNGKTTTTYLVKWLLESAGHRAGLVGTIKNLAGDRELPASRTTPEALDLFYMFSLMEQAGCDYMVIEASSHAIDLKRVASCNFAGAVFTNLTQDHLDYHITMDNYCRCKARLFAMLDENQANRYGIVNADDPYQHVFRENCRVPVVSYGSSAAADLRFGQYTASARGMTFELYYQGRQYQVNIPLLGKFNIYNSLAAMSVALCEGLDMESIIAAMSKAPQVAGRFELIDEGQDYTVVVDYAHTPDGLDNLLRAAIDLKPRRLITVFGCGGNRDKGKRPIMGRLAGSLSDIAIVTSDNPRFEDPEQIIKEVEAGVKEVCDNYLCITDRAEAIKRAIDMAQPGDMVVLAGKGHEDYQIVGDVKHHLDDREMARAFIRGRAAGSAK